jgi:uncharacterized ubiquitin-like protein YukD
VNDNDTIQKVINNAIKIQSTSLDPTQRTQLRLAYHGKILPSNGTIRTCGIEDRDILDSFIKLSREQAAQANEATNADPDDITFSMIEAVTSLNLRVKAR